MQRGTDAPKRVVGDSDDEDVRRRPLWQVRRVRRRRRGRRRGRRIKAALRFAARRRGLRSLWRRLSDGARRHLRLVTTRPPPRWRKRTTVCRRTRTRRVAPTTRLTHVAADDSDASEGELCRGARAMTTKILPSTVSSTPRGNGSARARRGLPRRRGELAAMQAARSISPRRTHASPVSGPLASAAWLAVCLPCILFRARAPPRRPHPKDAGAGSKRMARTHTHTHTQRLSLSPLSRLPALGGRPSAGAVASRLAGGGVCRPFATRSATPRVAPAS